MDLNLWAIKLTAYVINIINNSYNIIIHFWGISTSLLYSTLWISLCLMQHLVSNYNAWNNGRLIFRIEWSTQAVRESSVLSLSRSFFTSSSLILWSLNPSCWNCLNKLKNLSLWNQIKSNHHHHHHHLSSKFFFHYP